MSAHEYFLDARVLSLYKGDQCCAKLECKKEIEIGERVVTRRSGAGMRVMYHKKCADELNIVASINSKEQRTDKS